MPLPPNPTEPGDAPRSAPLPPPPPNASARTDASGELTCYRHSGRAVGRRCTRCGKPACPDCLRQVSIGSNCLDCIKAAKPDLRTRAKYWQAGKPAIVTYVLIGLNVAAFLGLGLLYGLPEMFGRTGSDAHLRFALSSGALDGRAKGFALLQDGSLYATAGNEWYRLITSGFLHYGIIHLALNMYFLYVLGTQMEPTLGRIRFASLYFAALLGGSAGALLLDSGLTAGASGAIYGLLGAFAVGIWQRGVNPFSTQIGTLLLINIGFTFLWPGISIGGHLGGLAAGAICGFVMMAPPYKGYPKWATYALPGAVGFVALAASFVFAR